MDKDLVKAKLLALEPTLKTAGIIHLHLHGSVVRGDATPESDVGLAAQFDNTKRLSLIDLVGLQNRIGCPTFWVRKRICVMPIACKHMYKAIPANIAEGFRRRGQADKARFMNMAEGSLEG